jgi:hypothetical protein
MCAENATNVWKNNNRYIVRNVFPETPGKTAMPRVCVTLAYLRPSETLDFLHFLPSLGARDPPDLVMWWDRILYAEIYPSRDRRGCSRETPRSLQKYLDCPNARERQRKEKSTREERVRRKKIPGRMMQEIP